MARARRFGPLFYGTLALAGVALLVTYGALEFGPAHREGFEIPALNRQWRNPSLPITAREKVAVDLVEFGDDAVPVYAAALNDPDSQVRAMACRYLASLRPISREAISACISALKIHPDPQTHSAVVQALETMVRASGSEDVPGSRRPLIAKVFLAAGHDESPMVRLAMIEAMTFAGTMIVNFGPWLEDRDRSVRLAAIEAIFHLDPANRGRIVPALRAMIRETDPAQHNDLAWLHGLLHETDPSACRRFLNGPDVPRRVRDEILRELRALVNNPDVQPDGRAEILQLLQQHEKASPAD